jgi:3-deoxy-D-manno-octulosonic-acid transferase
MRNFYTLGFYLALPFILLRHIWRTRGNKNHLKRMTERLGFYVFEQERESIWLHAVSYGEVVAAGPLVKMLLEHFQSPRIIITTMTLTGAVRVETTWKENKNIRHVYLPYDIPFAIKRFMGHFNPQIGIIMETELWPNLLYMAGKNHLPLLLANARLSPMSFKGYQRITRFISPFLKNLSIIAAQSTEDADRYVSLGIPSKKVVILGNMKFDIIPSEQQITHGKTIKTQLPFDYIITAASTHDTEEEQLLDAYALIKQSYPRSLLILVPRHPQRFDEVANLCIKKGHSVIRRSSDMLPNDTTTVYLGDTMGELYYFYALADIAFVGGSLVPVGGHNLLEPAALKLPIVTGPFLFNFKVIKQLLCETDTLHIVSSQEALVEVFKNLLQDLAYRQEIGSKGFDILAKNQGATSRHFQLVSSLMSHHPCAPANSAVRA